MAAAYAFHLSQNHPFVDGNKRTALDSAITFLELNGVSIKPATRVLHQAMMDIATKRLAKPGMDTLLQSLAR